MLTKSGLGVSVLPHEGAQEYAGLPSLDNISTETILINNNDKVCILIKVETTFDWSDCDALQVSIRLGSSKFLRPAKISRPAIPRDMFVIIEKWVIFDEVTKAWAFSEFEFTPILPSHTRTNTHNGPWFASAGVIVVAVQRILYVESEVKLPWERIPFIPLRPVADFGFRRPGLLHTIESVNRVRIDDADATDTGVAIPLEGSKGNLMKFNFEYRKASYKDYVQNRDAIVPLHIQCSDSVQAITSSQQGIQGGTETGDNEIISISKPRRELRNRSRLARPSYRDLAFLDYLSDEEKLDTPFPNSGGQLSTKKRKTNSNLNENRIMAQERSRSGSVIVLVPSISKNSAQEPARHQTPPRDVIVPAVPRTPGYHSASSQVGETGWKPLTPPSTGKGAGLRCSREDNTEEAAHAVVIRDQSVSQTSPSEACKRRKRFNLMIEQSKLCDEEQQNIKREQDLLKKERNIIKRRQERIAKELESLK